MEMNKKDIDQLAAFITEDPREFTDEYEDDDLDDIHDLDFDDPRALQSHNSMMQNDEEAKAHGFSQKAIDDHHSGHMAQRDQPGGSAGSQEARIASVGTGASYDDIKVNAQEREAQKRELADIARQGEEAQQFLSYIESVEHMSRSGLEY